MANIRIVTCGLLLGAVMLGGACERERSPLESKNFAPVTTVDVYLDGFHFHNGEIDRQVEAHHYVTMLDDGLMQALIFDGNGAGAKLIGIEYIISAERFEALPDEEKLLWHSHAYEVKSGQLIAPDLLAAGELELMSRLVSTYGKTWHTWHTHDNPEVPTGIPSLMMAFTADGQIDEELLSDRDQRFHIQTALIAKRRDDIPTPRSIRSPTPGRTAR